MGNLRFTDVQTRPTDVSDLTSLTLEEFRRLLPPFEAAFQAHGPVTFNGQPARPAGIRPTRTVHCPRPRIGCWYS